MYILACQTVADAYLLTYSGGNQITDYIGDFELDDDFFAEMVLEEPVDSSDDESDQDDDEEMREQ